MKCLACSLEHASIQPCSVARRLAATAAAKELHVTQTPVTVTANVPKSVAVTPKAAEQAVTVTRMAALRKRKAEAGLVAITIWAHPDDHAAIKVFAKSIQK